MPDESQCGGRTREYAGISSGLRTWFHSGSSPLSSQGMARGPLTSFSTEKKESARMHVRPGAVKFSDVTGCT